MTKHPQVTPNLRITLPRPFFFLGILHNDVSELTWSTSSGVGESQPVSRVDPCWVYCTCMMRVSSRNRRRHPLSFIVNHFPRGDPHCCFRFWEACGLSSFLCTSSSWEATTMVWVTMKCHAKDTSIDPLAAVFAAGTSIAACAAMGALAARATSNGTLQSQRRNATLELQGTSSRVALLCCCC